MTEYSVRALGDDTWDAFAQLIERAGNSSFGPPSCWCLWFHPRDLAGELGIDLERSVERSRRIKQRLVEDGRTHAALVFDGEIVVGWCQFGTPEELPNIYHRKEYEATLERRPDYRVTCFFVDRKHRRRRISEVALEGALQLIAEAGGGVVEGYPQDTGDKKVSATFLYSSTRGLFERAGFTYDRSKGKNHCVMFKIVAPVCTVTE